MTQPKQTPDQGRENIKDPVHKQASGAAPGVEPENPREPPASADKERSAKSIVEELQRQLQTAQASAVENQDKFLRAKAEADNIRKRAEIDIAEAHKYGLERFAAEMLAVRDGVEAAKGVDLSQGTAVVEKVLQGLDLTLKLMESAFDKFAIKVIDPQGQKFDPEKHQAMSMIETRDLPPNHVVQVVQKGYTLHNRLIRPALVVVSKAPPAVAPTQAPAEGHGAGG